MSDDITAHDDRQRRCPMLGHQVSFSYCRAPGAELPCRRVFDCWWEMFDVEAFVRSHFSDEDVQRIVAPRQQKAVTIYELIERARKNAEQQ